MRLFLDDIRSPPDDGGSAWTVARTAEEAKAILVSSVVVEASLDHDLGDCEECLKAWPAPQYRRVTSTCRHKMTGYDLVKWMAEFDRWPTTKPRVHSANPAGAASMIATIDRYWHEPVASLREASP
jgi:hypothetical protein